jgi:ABC-type branched-subunit amino acid transport system substrate-binding protein
MAREHDETKGEPTSDFKADRQVSRRDFLKLAGIAGAGLTVAGGLGGLIAACGGESTTTTTAGATTTTAAPTTTTAAPATTTTGAASTTSSSVVSGQTKSMKIGFTMPFSGGYGIYGQVMKPGIQAYVDILNEGGGVPIGNDMYKIEPLFPDDGADAKRGPIIAQQLIDAGAVANVGNFTQFGPFSLALNQGGVISVSNMWNDIDLTKCKYYFANMGYSGTFASFLAAKIFNTKSLAMYVYDWHYENFKLQLGYMNDGFGGGYPNDFQAGKITTQIQQTAYGNQDFSGQLSKMADDGVDTVLCNFGPGDFALAIKQAADQGFKFNWYTTGTLTDLPAFIKIAGQENCQGVRALCPVPWLYNEIPVQDSFKTLGQQICSRVEKTSGVPWNKQYLGIFEWGCGHLCALLDFMKQAGSIDKDAIMEKVIGGTTDGFTGKRTAGGQYIWKDADRPVVLPTNNMFIQIKGDAVDFGGELVQPSEFC